MVDVRVQRGHTCWTNGALGTGKGIAMTAIALDPGRPRAAYTSSSGGESHSAPSRTQELTDRALDRSSDVALAVGGVLGVQVAGSIARLRQRENYAVWVVVIVAIAIVAAAGLMAYVATICINRGGSFLGGLNVETNGWKVWEYRLEIECSQ